MSATESSTRQIVVFNLGETEYCLPVGQVREIIRYAAPQPTASALPWMRGVINLRGSIIPVCDLAMRIRGASEPNEHADARILIVENEDEQVGVVVSDVDEVSTVDSAQFETAPDSSDELIHSIGKVDGRLIMALDASSLLTGLLESTNEVLPATS